MSVDGRRVWARPERCETVSAFSAALAGFAKASRVATGEPITRLSGLPA